MTALSSPTHSELRPSEHLKVEGSIWLPLNVVSNGNASSSSQAVGVTKIAKSVIAPLAQQHVSVFMLSTYQTDFILVGLLFSCRQSFSIKNSSHFKSILQETLDSDIVLLRPTNSLYDLHFCAA